MSFRRRAAKHSQVYSCRAAALLKYRCWVVCGTTAQHRQTCTGAGTRFLNTLFSRQPLLIVVATECGQNGSSNLLTPYREQPRSTRIVVAYPRPAFSGTKRTNYAPISFDQQVQVSQGLTSYRNKKNWNNEVGHGGGGLELTYQFCDFVFFFIITLFIIKPFLDLGKNIVKWLGQCILPELAN